MTALKLYTDKLKRILSEGTETQKLRLISLLDQIHVEVEEREQLSILGENLHKRPPGVLLKLVRPG